MMLTRKWISTALGVLLAGLTAPALAQTNQATADAVASSLKASAGLAASRIGVETRGGYVTLSGVVPAAELKAEAVDRAQRVPGVLGVIDRLSVGDPRVVPAAFPGPMPGPVNTPPNLGGPTRIALGGHGHHGGGYAGGPMMLDGGMVGGPIAGGAPMVEGPLPEGAAMPGATQAAAPGYPNYAWPSYAPYPNFSAVGYPTVYPWQAWPNIGPFYPYPEVPLDWRAVTLRWDDGLWWLDFKKHYTRPFFTPYPFGLFAY